VKHLESCGCELYEEGAKHSKFRNLQTGEKTTVPRHKEIDDDFAKDICKQLRIPRIKS
jgi:predicted RNA binding protein YcfA (HicA-like mRNA interferase family)